MTEHHGRRHPTPLEQEIQYEENEQKDREVEDESRIEDIRIPDDDLANPVDYDREVDDLEPGDNEADEPPEEKHP